MRLGAVVYAKDLKRVSAFYAEVMGLTGAVAENDHVVLEKGGMPDGDSGDTDAHCGGV